MKAWVTAGGNLEMRDVPEPVPAGDELLVRVEAFSLNRGELRSVRRAVDGKILGWDVAGTVLHGPRAGTRVAALLNSGAWAEMAAVPAAHAAVVPEDVPLDVAATLPIAALTVVRAFDVAGSLLGRRILITGASGGVGQFAVQLGALAGAHVTAVTRRALPLAGAHVVTTIDEAEGEFDLILESVGGASLAAAIAKVARGGVVVTIGNSSEEETTFNARTLYAKGGARVYGLLIFEELESRRVRASDLERLLALVQNGRLHAPIELRRPWTELPAVIEEMEQRSFAGKAVLTVD
ncbi:MAG TPA: zinc-binding dehydrogenase [Thermoanaerobaculia bacterium]